MHHREPTGEEALERLRALGCTIGEPKYDPSHVMRLYPVQREARFKATVFAIAPSGVPLFSLRAHLLSLDIGWEEFWEGLP